MIYSYNFELIDLEKEKIILSQEKDNLESQLKRLESNDLGSDEIFNLSQEKDALQIELNLLESNDLESDEIFKLSQEKDSLELELEFLMQQNPTSTQLIGEIMTVDVKLKEVLIIFISFMFGLFFSIAVVFINNSLKAFKEEQV